ncbi:FUSC family protein [Streptomyces sp. NPDC059009]|uniref:FUSC family protein n=1 Tax=Streptomyces sp. NPDC059009 TaxID=3346694 RepID=UPI0036A2E307
MTDPAHPLNPSAPASPQVPPPWWRHALSGRPHPVDRALVVRGGAGILVPLAVGQATGHPVAGAAAALGAYGAALDDVGSGSYRVRALSLFLPQLGGAAGLALGRLTGGQAWAAIVLMAVVAVVSGLISTLGRVSSMAGLVLLLASIMGLGMPPTGPWWQQPLLFLAGGLPLMLLSLAPWPLRRHRAERTAVAEAYRAVAGLLEAGRERAAGGTSSAPAPTPWPQARRAVTGAMNHAYDLLVVRRLRPPRDRSVPAVLTARLDALVEVIAAAPAVRHAASPPPPEYVQALRSLADAIEQGAPEAEFGRLPAPRTPEDRALRAALEHTVLDEAVPDEAAPDEGALDEGVRSTGPAPVVHRRLGPHTPVRTRLRTALGRTLRDPESWQYALRLTACVTAAQTVASLTSLPRAPWLVLTVALIVRPDLGTVTGRTLLRCLGTVGGLLIGYAALTVLPGAWPRIAAVVVLTATLQAVGRRNYALQTICLTPIMILLADQMGHQGTTLLGARLADTLVGCAIALVVGYLLWPEHRAPHVPDRLAALHHDLAAYAEHTRTPAPDPLDQHLLRRRIHRQLAALQEEFLRARTDPRLRATLDRYEPLLTEAAEKAERIAATAARHPGRGTASHTTSDTTPRTTPRTTPHP